MNRKDKIIDLRPDLALSDESTGELELFQNKVLRPILKFQNNLLVEYLNSHPQYIPQAAKINPKDPKSHAEIITKFVKSNHGFRNKLYGMVAGMMTVEEYRLYLADKSEYNRRIVTMYVQRVLSQA